VLGRLSGPLGGTREVVFRDGGDQSQKLTLALVAPRGKLVKMGQMPPTSVWFESWRLAGEVGYIAFNIFLDPALVNGGFNKAMTEFLDAPGVVIDLRGNPGGIGAMSMGCAGWFVREQGRQLGVMKSRSTEIKFVVNPRGRTYDGPVAILVDELTASTSEILAGGLKDLGRARLFGMRTAGAALPSIIERLPNGDGFQYSFADYISEGGERLEGVGVTPHEVVPVSREALLAGRDATLEAALNWIATQSAGAGVVRMR
jgi:carboxyl-terminal processing protease